MAAPRELDLTVTLDAAWQAWSTHLYARVDADTMSPDTVRCYLSYARKAVTHLGPDRTCDSIEAHEIEAWVGTYRARGCGPATLRFCHKGIGGLLAFADSRRWLRENPMRDTAKIPLPTTPARADRAALTAPELDAMIQAARAGHGHANGHRGEWIRDEIVVRLLGESGLRSADVQNLDIGDVERDPAGNWQVQIRRGKGRKPRTTPITDACAQLILDYLDSWRPEPAGRPDRRDSHGKLLKGDQQALLLSRQRHRFHHASLGHLVGAISQAALGRHFVPHGLRHTAATLLLREAKADLATVAHILGHSNIAVTSRYLDVRGDEAAAAVNRRRATSKPKGPKALPPGPDAPRWPECGSRDGHVRHRREKVAACGPCRLWKREDVLKRNLLREMMPDRLHGTVTGRRDWRCSCTPCKAAVASADGAIDVPRRRTAPTESAACGSRKGHRRHRALGEESCERCIRANQIASRADHLGVRPLGECAECGEAWALNANGTVRKHRNCPGSRQPPAMPEQPALRLVTGSPSEQLRHQARLAASPDEEAS
ncbi:tyrosine-type recombinase/integrase [Streptomyces sp. cg28]|uniref:tyrosine-type recombinase/integrase n=1 Tax=Streptomyces sp. cg28 TaxID=3403457 RepID=UPI003B2264EE